MQLHGSHADGRIRGDGVGFTGVFGGEDNGVIGVGACETAGDAVG